MQRQNDRPMVFPGMGLTPRTTQRTAGLVQSAVFGGFGCDDTRAPSSAIEPAVVLLPDHVTSVDDPFAWLMFEGRWGGSSPRSTTVPPGRRPRTSGRTRSIGWRPRKSNGSSVSIPEVGTGVTHFFCSGERARSAAVHRLSGPSAPHCDRHRRHRRAHRVRGPLARGLEPRGPRPDQGRTPQWSDHSCRVDGCCAGTGDGTRRSRWWC